MGCSGAFVLVVALALTSGRLFVSTRRPTPLHDPLDNSCGGHSCPAYTLVKNIESDIEERHYEPIQFPSCIYTQCLSYIQALRQGFFYLELYEREIKNARGISLSRGVPVLTKARRVNEVEPKCDEMYTTSFYVNATFLPAPSNPYIQITSLEDPHVYVQTIGGYISDADRLEDLRYRLTAENLCFDSKTYYIADYQSPGTSAQRKTEIWVPARQCAEKKRSQ